MHNNCFLHCHVMSPTFVYQLPPSLGPLRQLLCVGFLDFATLLDAVHQVIAEPVTIVNALHAALVVPDLTSEKSHSVKSHSQQWDGSDVPVF